MATGAEYEVTEVGVRTPKEVVEDKLNCGDVGWVSAAIKNIEDVRVVIRSQWHLILQVNHYRDIVKCIQWYIVVYIQWIMRVMMI